MLVRQWPRAKQPPEARAVEAPLMGMGHRLGQERLRLMQTLETQVVTVSPGLSLTRREVAVAPALLAKTDLEVNLALVVVALVHH